MRSSQRSGLACELDVDEAIPYAYAAPVGNALHQHVAVFAICALLLLAQARAQRPELVVETGHSAKVFSVAISPNGKTLASASEDHTVKLWDVASGHQLRSLSGGSSEVLSVAFNHNGATVAAGTWDGDVKLWDVTTGLEVRDLKFHKLPVYALAFSPDGGTLASGSSEGVVILWNVSTGRLLNIVFIGREVECLAFHPDGQVLASAQADGPIKLWDVASGRQLNSLSGHTGWVASIAFNPDGKWLVSGSDDHTIKLWDLASGRVLRTFSGHDRLVHSVAFSPNGQTLVSGSWDKTIRLWDANSGQQLRTFTGHTDSVNAVAFSPDGNQVISGSYDHTIRLWDAKTGRELQSFVGHVDPVTALGVSPDGRTIAAGHLGHTITVVDFSASRELHTLLGHTDALHAVEFSSDGKILASAAGRRLFNDENTVKLWDVQSGRELRTLTGHATSISSVAFSPDGKTLASASRDESIRLWDVATGHELRTLTSPHGGVRTVAFSPDGKLLATGSGGLLPDKDNPVEIWDVATGRELHILLGHGSGVGAVTFSPDGKTLVSGSLRSIKLWDVTSGRELRSLVGHTHGVASLAFSPDGGTLASASSDGTIKLWNPVTGEELQTLIGHSADVVSVRFWPEKRFLTSASEDGSIRLWDRTSGKQLAALFFLGSNDWAVVDSDGRFDASPGGMKLLHWVVGLELVTLEQLKERYYEPGLLPKILGFNKDPLRDVSAFTTAALYPEMETLGPVDKSGRLQVKLKNRGGGIGRVQVFVNDKELMVDARGPQPDPSAEQASLSVDLAGAHALRGQKNQVRVVAWNQEGYLSSRGFDVEWVPEGKPDDHPPELYAIVAGISQYASPDIHLRFAAKDAQDMARALELGGKRLFGESRVHLNLLSSSGNPGVLAPTKLNLQRAFHAAQAARPGDVLVVYLAGHGVALQDLYIYPTQEARSLTAFSDPAIRDQTAITSAELVDWIKKIPALHQVMILDTCAAGAAAEKLVEKRDVPGDQIRALERLKDRTGFHVLMGSAADASSYEASQYGQGLLTYSLLQGMRGAALKNDVDVDVSKLFQYAADKVPEFARNIGGVQRPQILEQQGASFDVGQLQREDREKIPLAIVKPILLRPVVINPEAHGDPLGLMAALRTRLREENFSAARGESNGLNAVFVDEEDFPGAIRPFATYTVAGNQVTVNITLWRDTEKLTALDIAGSADDRSALVTNIINSITGFIGRKP